MGYSVLGVRRSHTKEDELVILGQLVDGLRADVMPCGAMKVRGRGAWHAFCCPGD